LRIAGDGELRPLAERAAAERGDVTYLGPLDRTQMARCPPGGSGGRGGPDLGRRPADRDPRGDGAGRPVVGTAVGGIPYLLNGDDGTAGWVVAPDADVLAAVLPVARSEAATLAPVARERYLHAFHPDVLTSRLIEIYTGLTADCRQAHR
jgi:hypothetical protein